MLKKIISQWQFKLRDYKLRWRSMCFNSDRKHSTSVRDIHWYHMDRHQPLPQKMNLIPIWKCENVHNTMAFIYFLFWDREYHDDIMKSKHFPRHWPFVREIHLWLVNSPVTRCFDVSFYLHLNKRLSKQSWGWWFETPSRSLWRHCNVVGWPKYLGIAMQIGLLAISSNVFYMMSTW